MPRYKIGDKVSVEGRWAKVVWFSENANEIEAIDEYIVEFEDRVRRFVISSELRSNPTQTVGNRDHDSDSCRG
jgi:ribulose kinase